MDWDTFQEASEEGQLLQLLEKLPRARWAVRSPDGYTFLHYACFGSNVAALVVLLTSGLHLDVDASDNWGRRPVHLAAEYGQTRALEVLCAVGANLRVRDQDGHTPIDAALAIDVRVLVANGVRLSTALDLNYHLHRVTHKMVAFERGVLRCREAVVAMLRVKRAGRLERWDKFLLAHMAVELWASRYAVEWIC